ncbi:MAG TPA: peptidylprolyl isomerase [Candidatus Binataceae bacterium]|jgi:peptidyl-prolyl cis-trans isomerase SurA|nr:peptidylprolyl isomerase [Candidatus Binataceae bacterium]
MRKIAEIRIATLAALTTAALTGLLITFYVRSLGAEEIDSVVASVDGDPITSHDLKTQAAAPGGAAAAGYAPATSSDPDDALKNAIAQRMLEQESRKYAAKVDDDEVDRYIRNLAQQNHLTVDQLRTQLSSQNMSYDEFRAKIRKQVEAMTMIDQEVRQKIVVPEDAIDIYYKNNPDEFTSASEKFKLAQILISVPDGATPQQIEDLRRKADDVHSQAVKKDADFSALALKYSDDDSKTKGGELGEFSPGDLNDAVAAAIKDSKDGDISPVVKTKYGFHIVKVEQHQLPGVKPLDQVRAQIREKLMTEQSKVAFQKWIESDLIKQHYVETLQQ